MGGKGQFNLPLRVSGYIWWQEDREGEGGNKGLQAVKNGVSSEEEDVG